MRCDYFDDGRCRSCTLMGTPYRAQLAEKAARVREVLAAHTTGTVWSAPVTSPESHFRNKAKLVVGGRATDPTLGILDPGGHGQDLRRCGLYEPGLAATFDPLHRFLSRLALEPYDVPRRRGELKHVIATHSPDGEHLVRFVVRSQRSVDRLRDALPLLLEALPSARVVTANVLPEHKAVLEGELEVPLTEQTLLPMRLGHVTLLLGPRAFFQTNTRVATELYAQARAWADTARPQTVWDLYCGVGGFALHLAAPGRRVVGVETSTEAVAAAREAARSVPGTAEFVVGDATSEIPSPAADLIVVNPPRRGLGAELAGRLDHSPATSLVYSSCNAETLSRDLAAMPSWRTVEARVVDMFPQTRHVETVALLERR
jgi:23S rRNA (uracil747-C5)-methyltransferase